jgi:hypothetical protein
MLGNRDVDRLLLMGCPPGFFKENKNWYVHRICDDNFWRSKLQKDFPLRSKYVYCEMTPKKLYFLLVNHKSRIFEISYENADCQFIIDTHPNILRGDIVRYNGYSYRNLGKYIWNGETLINLEYHYDDYGHAPKDICFPEVPLDFYLDSIAHNEYIYLSIEKSQELIENTVIFSSTISDNYSYYNITIQDDTLTEETYIPFIVSRYEFTLTWGQP